MSRCRSTYHPVKKPRLEAPPPVTFGSKKPNTISGLSRRMSCSWGSVFQTAKQFCIALDHGYFWKKNGKETIHNHTLYIIICIYIYTLEFNHHLKHGGSFWMMINPWKMVAHNLNYGGWTSRVCYIPGTQMTPVLIRVWAFFWRVFEPQNTGHSQVPGISIYWVVWVYVYLTWILNELVRLWCLGCLKLAAEVMWHVL